MSHKIIKGLALATLAAVFSAPVYASGGKSPEEKRQELNDKTHDAADVIAESVRTDDHAIPESLLKYATCVATLPNVVRAGFVFGGKYGTGMVSCRVKDANGKPHWSNPSYVKLTGGSWGFEVGVDSTDLVLVFVNLDAPKYFAKDNFTLGGDASVTAGPLGRQSSAQTDWRLNGEIYSYSHSKGLFLGFAVQGSLLAIDDESNQLMYNVSTTDSIFTNLTKESDVDSEYIDALNKYAPDAK